MAIVQAGMNQMYLVGVPKLAAISLSIVAIIGIGQNERPYPIERI